MSVESRANTEIPITANNTEAEAKSKVYLGDFKPYEFEGSGNAAATVEAPTLQTDGEDDLPF